MKKAKETHDPVLLLAARRELRRKHPADYICRNYYCCNLSNKLAALAASK
jgi:hypothetical protein